MDDVLGRIRFKMSEASEAKWGANKPPTDQMMEVRGRIDRLREHFQRLEGPVLGQHLSQFQRLLIEDLYDKIDVLKMNVDSRPMEMGDLPPRLRERFFEENGIFLMRVYPAVDVWEPPNLSRFVEDLRTVDPDVIGDPVTLYCRLLFKLSQMVERLGERKYIPERGIDDTFGVDPLSAARRLICAV